MKHESIQVLFFHKDLNSSIFEQKCTQFPETFPLHLPSTPKKTSNKLDTISQARSLAEVQTLPVPGVSIQHVSPFDHIQSIPHPHAPKQKTSQLGWGTFALSLYTVYFKYSQYSQIYSQIISKIVTVTHFASDATTHYSTPLSFVQSPACFSHLEAPRQELQARESFMHEAPSLVPKLHAYNCRGAYHSSLETA